MSNIRLTDILKNKKEGEEWHCLAAPEETKVWTSKSPWNKDTFSKRKVVPVAVSVASGEVAAIHIDKFTLKSPLIMKNGLDITKGRIKTRQYRSASFTIRVDSCIELNEVLKELSDKLALKTWLIKRIVIYNKEHGISTEFKPHNPNGTGIGLYSYRFEKEKNSWLYPNVMISDQILYVGNFYDEMAHCTAAKSEELIHACAIEKKVKSKQIKLRKK